MKNVKPVDVNVKFGAIGFLIFTTAVIAAIIKWKEFYDFFVPNGILLNWRFVFLLILIPALIISFYLNNCWKNEYNAHEITKKDRDNYKKELMNSENLRLTDVITGVPNSEALEIDIENYFSKSEKKMQYIFIDLKKFRKINEKFGFNKTNDLLRTIAQTIYNRMRRTEQMYKCSIGGSESKLGEKIYRVYPGGDEFVFIIFGDQSDALGFSNRLVGIFNEISEKTPQILGQYTKLSFSCAIVEMHCKDSSKDLFLKIEPCYNAAKEGESDFTIYWHPYDIEKMLSTDKRKAHEYERARELFQVMTPIDRDYGL